MPEKDESKAADKGVVITALVSLIVAGVGAVSTALGTWYNAHAQRDLEREQFQSSLMLRAIDPYDRKKSIEGVRFLIEAGFVSEGNEKVLKVLRDTSFHIPLSTEKLPIPTPNKAHYDYSTSVAPGIVPQSGRTRLQERRAQIVPYGSANTRRSFSGIVVDELTQKPLAGVTVAAITNDAPESMVTDRDGKFTLHYPYKAWALWALRPGYVKFERWESPNMVLPDNMIIELDRLEEK